MALKLGELVTILKADTTPLERGLDEGKVKARRAGADTATAYTRGADGRLRDERGKFVKAGQEAGEALGEGFTRGADGKLRDARGRFVREATKAVADAGGGGLGSLRRAMDNLGTGVTNVATNVWNLLSALIGIGSTAAMAVPSVYLLGGALGSLPALMVGLGAGVGALGIGFMGLSDHFRETASSGGAVVDRAYQIAQAERRVRDANREVLDATEALNRARQRAAENLQDLNRNLASARLDEESAVLAVAEAQRDLEQARRGGDYLEIQRAELAYRQAQQAVLDVRDRVEDLAAEQAEASRKGVEGSDEVTDALDRQRRAIEAVEDAQHSLREAQRPPAGGGAAAELTKLAPAAQEVVNVLKSLKPAWESLRLDVQQRLFKGVGGELRQLASAWLPQLHRSLGGMATMFNGLFRDFAKNARRPEFIRNIGAGIDSVRQMLDRIGRSITGPLLDAFGRLSRAAAPFVTALGDEIASLVEDFSRWIASADKSGKLEGFFDKASTFLRDVFAIGRDIGSIFGSVMQILFSEEQISTTPWVSFRDSLDGIAAWFKDPQNQEKVREWIDRIKDFGRWLITEGIPTVAGWVDRVSGWVSRAEEWGGRIVDFKNDVVAAFNSIITFFDRAPGRISAAARGMWNGLWTSFKATLNRIIGGWNSLSFSLGGGTFAGITVPRIPVETPNLPYLAKGGTAVAPGLAVVGDAGPELAYMNRGATIQPLTGSNALGAAGAALVRLLLQGEFRIRGRDLVLVLREEIADLGGNVQRAVGSNT